MQQLLKIAYKHSEHAEHFGFVLVAYCDVFELHHWLFAVSLWLAVTGVPSFIRDCRGA